MPLFTTYASYLISSILQRLKYMYPKSTLGTTRGIPTQHPPYFHPPHTYLLGPYHVLIHKYRFVPTLYHTSQTLTLIIPNTQSMKDSIFQVFQAKDLVYHGLYEYDAAGRGFEDLNNNIKFPSFQRHDVAFRGDDREMQIDVIFKAPIPCRTLFHCGSPRPHHFEGASYYYLQNRLYKYGILTRL